MKLCQKEIVRFKEKINLVRIKSYKNSIYIVLLCSGKTEVENWHHDIQHNNTQTNGTQHNDTLHNDTQYNDP